MNPVIEYKRWIGSLGIPSLSISKAYAKVSVPFAPARASLNCVNVLAYKMNKEIKNIVSNTGILEIFFKVSPF